MPIRHLLDPEIAPAVEALPIPDLTADLLPMMRSFTFPQGELSDAVSREETEVPGERPIPVRVHRPVGQDDALPGILAIHGGGYVIGDRTMYDALFDRWCVELGVVGVSVGYRLAPETPFPGPLDDCYAALQWTSAHADHLGIDPTCIGVYGASAGGGLAAGHRRTGGSCFGWANASTPDKMQYRVHQL